MKLNATLKKHFQSATSLVSAVALVCVLLLLQAYSISTDKQTKFLKIYTPPPASDVKPKPTEKVRETFFSDTSVGANTPRTLNVNIPTVSSSNFKLPEFSLSKNDVGTGDFSISMFDYAKKGDFNVEVFSLDMLDKIPRRIDNTRIVYPKQMLNRGIEGEVKLMVIIDKTGALSIEQVLQATNNFFKECAIAAVSQFVYETPTRNGKAVKARFILPIPFKINK